MHSVEALSIEKAYGQAIQTERVQHVQASEMMAIRMSVAKKRQQQQQWSRVSGCDTTASVACVCVHSLSTTSTAMPTKNTKYSGPMMN